MASQLDLELRGTKGLFAPLWSKDACEKTESIVHSGVGFDRLAPILLELCLINSKSQEIARTSIFYSSGCRLLKITL